MAQTVRTIAVDVQPHSVQVLRKLIGDLRAEEEGPPPGYAKAYDRLKARAPALHFMAMSVFEAADYDPIFVIEANFDGPAGPFWAQLEAAIPALRDMLSCCKRPAGPLGDVHDAIRGLDSRYPLAPYLEAHEVKPMVYHSGNRGLGRDRIHRESELFAAVRDELAKAETRAPNPYRPASASEIHQRLRGVMVSAFPWLDESPAARVPPAENLADIVRLIGFVCVAVFCLSVPGVLLALTTTWWIAIAISLAAAAIVARTITDLKDLRQPPIAKPRSISPQAVALLLAGLAGYLILLGCAGALIFAPLTPLSLPETFGVAVLALLVGLFSIPFSVLGILSWLRRLERRDPSHDAPPIDQKLMREIMQNEDRVVQNHMGSLVLVKPGLLRAVLVRAGLVGLGLILRIVARNGYLGDMRTIHFAHWALVNNGSRLLFFSNFDGTWESYLDDFIEKAHAGLTLAWANGVGFPPARFLSLEGATHGRLFKAWARHSMTSNQFWFSAYPDFTVNQIERHAVVADGLRRTSFSKPGEAERWACSL